MPMLTIHAQVNPTAPLARGTLTVCGTEIGTYVLTPDFSGRGIELQLDADMLRSILTAGVLPTSAVRATTPSPNKSWRDQPPLL